ncbi:ribosome-binding factor A [Halorhodospira halochloris]|uniref:Ribosome-binding factor A n=1 Tax=Halorhodospira halochloris TaxID=1052 RepID=A0A0X8X9F7_HALHR|nr:30S ribosome-binding factor RbfA [Halorhodospira halochloris]MBK1652507.1 ribosome-binding factor A [Halorhodospira halochloris]MCG5548691.1 30S ribosome-binding factor RbfA [Halorhodospira halochloris]BAU57829.1 ribosome-binding factor A [Halorhodospira halochloris]
MAKDYPRSRRMAEQIRRELDEVIREDVDDPRVGSVTLSEVQVSRDLGQAHIYVSVLGAQAEEVESCVEVLNQAHGFLRTRVAKKIRSKRMPQLRFVHDTAFDRAARLSAIIDEVAPQSESQAESDVDSEASKE